MKKQKILLAEDEVLLGEILTDNLKTRGYNVMWCKDGLEAYDTYLHFNPDLILLDVMMPKMDGFETARKIRNQNQTVPILFLTAKSMKEDIIEGFQSGADDYIRKPFGMEELILRIKAIIRRSHLEQDDEDEGQGLKKIGKKFTFDPIRQMLFGQEIGEVRLTAKESELLNLLIQKKNALLDREYALKKLWGDDTFFNARSMDVFMSKIRKLLKEDDTIEIINVRGKGYKLVDK